MLEKIGLPPKPSLRGNNWVIDASHCQGCSSQFTFINRKHHCRRCGGLFCGSCTQQRMYLRGQGESPVRICDPCKTLEEAARFEMRYGHKNKSRKGASKLAADNEDDASVDGSVSLDKESVPSIQRATSASASNSDMEFDLESTTPEELRQRAIEEKNKYKVLKAEKKPDEALRAFKRGKELERQAAALEIELRKNRKKAISSTSANENSKVADEKKPKDKDDLVSELRELGWSDLDLHDADKKPVSMTLEGELSTLLKEVSPKTSKPEKGIVSIDRSEVVAIKKNALALKREGKLTEAKEELKRAKILEKQIEEQELLGDDEDSDDEFTSLIRSMDIDKQDILAHGNDRNPNFDFDHLLRMDDGPHLDGNFEVTEDDMDDPEMSAALQSLGWSEDHDAVDKESLLSEIQSIKREALDKKRAGNTAEALALLRKAKLLEAEAGGTHDTRENDDVSLSKPKLDIDHKLASKSKLEIQRELLALKKKALALRREGKVDEADQEFAKGKALEQRLEELESGSKVNMPKVKPTSMRHTDVSAPIMDVVEDLEEDVTDTDMNDPSYLALLENLGWQDDGPAEVAPPKQQNVAPKKSKAEIQRELLALKRKSLALRRQGNVDEAEEVLKATKDLEAQLEEIETPSQETILPAPPKQQNAAPKKSKAEIQRELLALKRKSLALRRQGNLDEAEEVLKATKDLEAQLEEMETPSQETIMVNNSPEKTVFSEVFVHEKPRAGIKEESSGSKSTIGDVFEHEKPRVGIKEESSGSKSTIGDDSEHEKPQVGVTESISVQQQILAHKRKALSLKREGKIAEAKEELKQAKLLEKESTDVPNKTPNKSPDLHTGDKTPVPSTSKVAKKEESDDSPPKLSSRERFKLQQQSLSHKRQALKLRREGRHEEADAEFELAKNLESQLEAANELTKPAEHVDDVSIEDLLDPQLLSALREVGIEGPLAQSSSEKTEPVRTRPVANKIQAEPVKAKTVVSKSETTELEEQIKAEKAKALNLKRAGKQAEALDALRRAKVLEKKLNSLA